MLSAQELNQNASTSGMSRDIRTTRLAGAVQALPQELYDMIYKYTFTPNARDYIIDDTYRPSHLLRVDRGSRQRFCMKYYGSGHPFYVATKEHCQRWIASMQALYRLCLTEIRIVGPPVETSRDLFWPLDFQIQMLNRHIPLIWNFGVTYDMSPRLFRHKVDFEGKQYWMSTDEDPNDLLAKQKVAMNLTAAQ